MIKGKFVYWSSPEVYFTGQVVDVADGFALIQMDSKVVGASPMEIVSLKRIDEDGMWRFFDTLEQMATYVEYCEAPGGNKPIRLVPKDGGHLQ